MSRYYLVAQIKNISSMLGTLVSIDPLVQYHTTKIVHMLIKLYGDSHLCLWTFELLFSKSGGVIQLNETTADRHRRSTCDTQVMFLIKLYRQVLLGYEYLQNCNPPPICDLVAHLAVYNGRSSDSRTFEKMTVKSATIINLHFRDNVTVHKNYMEHLFIF